MYLGKRLNPSYIWHSTTGVEIMTQGVKSKFSSEDMKDYLLSTTGIIGEATTHSFWGIGHTLSSDNAKCIANWTGSSALGEILTNLRDDLAT